MTFATQPASGTAGQALPSFQVSVHDASASPVAGVLVTLTVGANPGGSGLSGTPSKLTNASGAAVFSNVELNRGGHGYSLDASAGVFTARSLPFDVAGFASAGNTSAISRVAHTATRLLDDHVLVAGGSPAVGVATTTVESYDPVTRWFTLSGSMMTPRAGASAVMLPDGRVLVTGGSNGTSAVATAESTTRARASTRRWLTR